MVAGAGLDKKLRPSTIVYEKLSPTSYQLLGIDLIVIEFYI